MAPSSAASRLEDPARRRKRMLELTSELSDAATLEQLATIVVDHGREALDAAMVGLWLVSPRGDEATMLGWRGLDELAPRFASIRVDRSLPLGEALIDGTAVWLESREEFSRRYPSQELQHRRLSGSDEIAFACLPLVTQGRALGGLALTFLGARHFDEEERTFLLVLARHGATAIERVRLAEAERRTKERLRLLADAGERLAESLDLSETLRAVMDLVLPSFADFCAFDLFDEDAGRVTVANGDPDLVRAVEALRARYPDSIAAQPMAIDVLRGGRARLVEHVTDEMLRARAADEEHLAALRALGFVSGILAPVVARGRLLGLLSFVMARSGRRYDEDDVTFAEELASRAALAVANAQLYHAERAARAQLEAERAALAHSEALFRGAQDMSHEGFRLYRPIREGSRVVDLECIYQNSAAGELSGIPAEVAVGGRLSALFPRARELGFVERYARVAETGEPHEFESHYADEHISGIYRFVVMRIGECVAVTFSSVTEQRRDEARRVFLAEAAVALASSLDRAQMLRVLTASAVPRLADACAIDLVDDEGRIERVAATMANPDLQALAMRWWERFAPEGPDGDWVREAVASRRASGIVDYDPAREAPKGNPETMRILRELGVRQVIVVPLAYGERAFGVASLLMTTSGRRFAEPDLALAEELARRAAIAFENARLYGLAQEARHRAEEANRLKDEFLATVSHELRTPLNAIVGWANILRGPRVEDTALVEKGLEVIRRNADAQTRLIDDILDVSRIITGKLKIEPSPIDMRALVDEALDVVRPSAEAKGITLALARGEAPALLVGDPDRLRQALWNLLSNAVKFTDRGGRVSARIERAESEIIVIIEDTGCGIDPAFLPHVFERFTQAERSTSRRFGGLGLGLAIVRHLVELHGGSVRAESRGLGHGAAFRLTLPIRAAEIAAAPASPAA